MRPSVPFVLLVFISFGCVHAQEVLNKTLLKGDKLYINRNYSEAVVFYVKYLEEFPRDYYASRQAAICYDRLNEPDNAIDYWPVVVESSEATESDYLAYGKSLLANNREPEAKKVFLFLSRSRNSGVAAWGKTYLNPAFTKIDSAEVKILELSDFNTVKSEMCPVVFKDKLFYILDQEPGALNYKAMSNLSTQNIRVSIPRDSIHFLPSLLFEKLQTLSVYGQFCFSPDGDWLYFSRPLSNKELSVRSPQVFYKYQLFKLKMSTLHNMVPEIIAFEHNQVDYNYLHPAFSHDGKQLYFASDQKGSMGGMDIYVCEKTAEGWSIPRNLGAEVNSSGNEVFPHMSSDSLLYFSSDQRPGRGGLDIFSAKAFKEGERLFEPAMNCGAPINSRFDDFGVYLLKNSGAGYLSSKRKENKDADLYYFFKILK